MSRVCSVCGKGKMSGNQVSHSNRKTRRSWAPNVQKVKVKTATGGAESTYTRIHQVIKTANANTSIPTYLYINGRQANVIGGEGIMIKQPLSERSFDE